MSLHNLPANKPDEHYLERAWEKLSVEFIHPSSDPLMCAYMKLAYVIGANISLGHYTRQENKDDRRQAREFMSEEIQKLLPEITQWVKDHKPT